MLDCRRYSDCTKDSREKLRSDIECDILTYRFRVGQSGGLHHSHGLVLAAFELGRLRSLLEGHSPNHGTPNG